MDNKSIQSCRVRDICAVRIFKFNRPPLSYPSVVIYSMEKDLKPEKDDSICNLNSLMKDITNLMDRLETIRDKITPVDFSSYEDGTKKALMLLFEKSCYSSKNLSDDQLMEEHHNLRKLLDDPKIPKGNNIEKYLSRNPSTESFNSLYDWCKEKGSNLENIKLEKCPDSDNLRVVATQTVEPNKPFLILHEDVLIRRGKHLENNLFSSDPVVLSMQDISLALHVLVLFYRNNQSEFWPYLNSLPNSYDNACYFSENDFLFLKGSPCFRDALDIWKSVVRQYAYFHLKMLEQSLNKPNALGQSTNLLENFCYEDYRWSFATVMSRGTIVNTMSSSEHELLLVPILDMCKHSDVIFSFEKNPNESKFEAYLTEYIQKGEDVCIFKGARTNSHFLIQCGILPERNPHDFIMFRLPLKSDMCAVSEKRALMLKVGLSEATGFALSTDDVTRSEEVMAYMRIYVANAQEISDLNKLSEDELTEKLLSKKQLSENNEQNARKKLLESLKEAHCSLDKSLSFAEESMKSCSRASIAQMIKGLKESENKNLENVLKILEAQKA